VKMLAWLVPFVLAIGIACCAMVERYTGLDISSIGVRPSATATPSAAPSPALFLILCDPDGGCHKIPYTSFEKSD